MESLGVVFVHANNHCFFSFLSLFVFLYRVYSDTVSHQQVITLVFIPFYEVNGKGGARTVIVYSRGRRGRGGGKGGRGSRRITSQNNTKSVIVSMPDSTLRSVAHNENLIVMILRLFGLTLEPIFVYFFSFHILI